MVEPSDYWKEAKELCPYCGTKMAYHYHSVERYSSYSHKDDHTVLIYKCSKCGHHIDKSTKPVSSYPKYNYQGREK